MNAANVRPKLRVEVIALGSTKGMIIKLEHLRNRREGAIGTVLRKVAGRVNTWWVQHDQGKTIGVYTNHELQPLEDQRPPPRPLGSPKAKSLLD